MSVFTGLQDHTTSVPEVKKEEPETHEQIFPADWSCEPTQRVKQVHVPKPSSFNSQEEVVLQRIDSQLSSILNEISLGNLPCIRSHSDGSKDSSMQLHLSLTNAGEAQRFCRAMAVMESVQVGT